MEKCWFVLKQSHYPPPDLPKSGIGMANGAISLGHIIPDSINLDDVINRSEECIKFTPTVKIHHTASWGVDWKRDTGLEAALSANVKASIGAEVPVLAEQQIKLAFEHTEKNHKEFGTLDRYIIQVDRKFIRGILEDKVVNDHIKRTKRVRLLGVGGQWSVFMITGIIVARGAKGESGENETLGISERTAVNGADMVSGGLAEDFENSKITSLSAQKMSDFVWAVRLTKIWQGALEKDWNFRTVTRGATFSMDCEKPWRDEIQRTLSQELPDVGMFQTFDLPDEEGMIVY